ncbi:MAG: hypothetical protein WCV62_02380 [Candidatus Peribacteraceae bacterium]|jgi:CMP-N-acetylneuraminic acid synthetase
MAGVLALIPARSGSKTVLDKNLRCIAGKPLLVHAIEQAKHAASVGRVIVSTDSERYADIARQAGAEVPFLRPAEFAGDLSTDLEVFTHAMQWLQEHEGTVPDICVHLRPTFPLRRSEDIDAVVRILLADPTLDSVRSVAPARQIPFKMWTMREDKTLVPAAICDRKEAHNLPRQLLPTAYAQNACIDAVRSSVILEKQSMTGRRIFGYLMEENSDIDTEEDLFRAEWKLLSRSWRSGGKPLVICFDIDGVVAEFLPDINYERAQPNKGMVALIRRLHAAGHRIILYTARGSETGRDWKALTERQMTEWGVPYHALHFGKPAADVYVDDRALPPYLSASLLHSHGDTL